MIASSRLSRQATTVILIGVLTVLLHLSARLGLKVIRAAGTDLNVGTDRAWLLLVAALTVTCTILLVGLYAWLLDLVRRNVLRTTTAKSLAFGFPVLLSLGLVLDVPVLSVDHVNYLAFGYLSNLPGGNPYVHSASSVADTPFGAELRGLNWAVPPGHSGFWGGPSPYGPLWNGLVAGAVWLTADARTAMVLTKGLIVAANLGSAALIYWVLGSVRQDVRLFGTLMYLWNPLVIVEFAGEGHNDALMIMAILVSLAASLRARPATALVAVVLGTLLKYMPVVLMPAQVIYAWSTARDRHDLAKRLGLSVLLALVLGVLAFLPFWRGAETFTSLVVESELLDGESTSVPKLTNVVRAGLFGVFVVLASWHARTAPRLLLTCGAITVVYVYVGAPEYWPWYSALPLALLALWPLPGVGWVVTSITLLGQLYALIRQMAEQGLVDPGLVVWGSRVARTLPLVGYGLLVATAGREVFGKHVPLSGPGD